MPFDFFHPITAAWFTQTFGEATEPQRLSWPAIARGENTLIAAPTGSGKTFSAFLVCIDRLVREALEGTLKDECKVLYLSPLKALASDIRKNLEQPLAEIQLRMTHAGYFFDPIRSASRTGDTPSHERQKILRKPPHILVTTPESFYLMLTSEKGRGVLRTIETVIIDEIHALARDKRGSHLSLSLERLKALTTKKPTLIGLSATQKPVEEIASFLVGRDNACSIFDVGHARNLDMGLIIPPSPLGTVASGEQWEEIYGLIAEEIKRHRSTLLFVNTRRLAERMAYRLSEMLGEDQVLCHHGSLSKHRRLQAEQLLKEGKLKAIVATASLELGIDIGFIDLVCQIGVPYSIATFLQRIGRSGHAIKATPKGRMVPLTRDELVESLALMKAVKSGELDRIEIPKAPFDILTQHIIAESAGRGPEVSTPVDEAFRLYTGAWPYRNLTRDEFVKVIEMAADGFAAGRRRFAYLIWDRLSDRISVRAGARLAALTSGGAIPELGEYRVVLEDDGTTVGTVNEDFAIESLAGDIFLLGTHSWRICHVRGGEVTVRDAHGQPPSIPFWEGEAPGRTQEFSISVADLRLKISELLSDDDFSESQALSLEAVDQIRHFPRLPYEEARAYLSAVTGYGDDWAILQAVHYIAVQKAALGVVPNRNQIVFERFFDEAGGMQLVIHSPYGSRINRAWGLALRKRFCRAFDFELQASADDDGIVLSLGPQQSFAIETLFKMLNADNVEHFLTQALLAAPMFGARWRWNSTRALAVLRHSRGKKVAPALQRFRSEDLLSAVFPAQTACQENAPADIEVPDHPLVRQTISDCMTEAMDLVGVRALFTEIEAGRVTLVAKDTREPSPFAYQLLNGYSYVFLDGGEIQNRRTRMVAMRPALSIAELRGLDKMSPAAIREVQEEAWPAPKTADQLYETLVATPAFPLAHTKEWQPLADDLVLQKRAAIGLVRDNEKTFQFLVAAEAMPIVGAVYENIEWSQTIVLPPSIPKAPEKEIGWQNILKGWLEIRGPVPTEELTELFGIENAESHLAALEATGIIIRCKMTPQDTTYTHWCARGLLRRIHRLTVDGLREQIRPVSPEDYFSLVFEEHGLTLGMGNRPRLSGADGLESVISRLQGFESAALGWELELFSSRMESYDTSYLDQLTSKGVIAFGRLTAKRNDRPLPSGRSQKLTSVMPLTFLFRKEWGNVAVKDPERPECETVPSHLSSSAQLVWEALKRGGAQFIDEIMGETALLETQVEGALGELASEGIVTCDQFHALRAILSPAKRERSKGLRDAQGVYGGRWSLMRRSELTDPEKKERRVEWWATQLLARYGVVFRDLLERETLAPSWGELVRVYRRLEARGELRGGRFIAGVSGEQYALAETHQKLIKIREERSEGKRRGSYAVISSADPLNLVGIVTKGERIPAHSSTRILFEDGEVSATCRGYDVSVVRPVSEEKLKAVRLIGFFRSRAFADPAAGPSEAFPEIVPSQLAIDNSCLTN